MVGVIGLLILAAITIQIVLWTSVPKSIVVSQIENGLGLRIGVTGLSTGWLGRTKMTGVKLALPLSDAVVDVPSMEVRHTNLIAILLGWPVLIKEVDLEKPVIYVRQDASGVWNVQEVAELVARTAGKKTGEQTQQTSAPSLPWLKVDQMTVVVLDNRHHEVKVAPINVDGQPDSAVSWKYDVEIPSGQANVPPHVSLVGRVAPGGDWAHEAHVWIHDIDPWVRPFVPNFQTPVTFDGRWSGDVPSTGVRGFLQISDARYGDYHVDGAAAAMDNNGVYSVNPRNLRLRTSLPQLTEVRIPSGTLAYDGKAYRATRLQLALLGGPAAIDGWYQPDVRQGAVQASWENLTFGKAHVKGGGKLQANYTAPQAADLAISARIDARGAAPQGPFEIVADLNATGPRIADLTWRLDAPALAWYRGQQLILNGVHAEGTYQQDSAHKTLRLDRVSLPADNRLAGNGFYDFQTNLWKMHLEGQDWPIHLVQGTRLAFGLDGTGKVVESDAAPNQKAQYVELDRFFLRSGDAELSVNGTYDGRKPKPVSANVKFANNPGTAAQLGRPALVHGWIVGQASLEGVLWPKNDIAIAGSLESRDAELFGHPVGDMRTLVKGGITNERAWLGADAIPFLDGIWSLGADYVMQQADRDVYRTTVSMSVAHLPLRRLTQFFNAQEVLGRFDGSWNIEFPGLVPRPDQIIAHGDGTIQDMAVSYLVADKVSVQATLQDGTFRVDPIQLTRGGYGRIDAHADLSLNQWRQVHAGLLFSAWPIEIPQAQLTLQLWRGANQIDIALPDARATEPDARKLRVETNLQLRTAISMRQQPEGEVNFGLSMHGRTVDLRALNGSLFGGTISGDAVTDLDRIFQQSRATLAWRNIQSDRFVRLFPQLKGFAGTFSGHARLEPSTDPRPLEPLALGVYLHSTAAHWQTVRIGDGELNAYIGKDRIIGDDFRPSSLQIANGLLRFWFSSSSHYDVEPLPNGVGGRITGVTISNQLNVGLEAIEVDQFVKAFDPRHPPGFGRLGGQLFLLSAPKTRTLAAIAKSAAEVSTATQLTTRPATNSATVPATRAAPTAPAQTIAQQQSMLQQILSTTTLDGTLQLQNSNLANFGPIRFLYDLMRLGGDVRTPTGHGSVALHMEQGKLHISNLYYFNRGIEVRGIATADQMWNIPDNPIQGSAIGTARPLKNIHLPLFAEADALLSAVQGELTSIEFKGTVRNPVKDYVRQLRLTQLGGELRGLLLGELGANRGS